MLKNLAVSVVALVSLVSISPAAGNFDASGLEKSPGAANFVADWFPAPVEAPAPEKDWTIMVFINGKNNLEKYALRDINEMEMIGSSDRVNVVVEAGRIEGYDASDGDWKGVRRYLIQKDANPAAVTSPVVQDLGKVDMGDYRSVIDFGKWAKTAYPARKTMLIIWNHGAGWTKSRKTSVVTRGISYDDETNNHINTPQMAAILKEMGGVDIYGSDACLMQMAEVIYEIKDFAGFIVGSEETEPGDGYTYNTFLAPLVSDPGMSAEAFARVAVDSYSDHYKAQKEGSTQSYIRTSAIPGFLAMVDDFAFVTAMAGEKAIVKQALASAQSYAYPANKDLYHFAQLVTAGSADPAVKENGAALMAYIETELVGYNRTNNGAGDDSDPPSDYSRSHGIAVYLPPSAPSAGYDALRWAKDSNWYEFIKWYQRP
ncbi:MAG: clostripain-related cysteine peptidase [Elusimicrobiales bacterium]